MLAISSFGLWSIRLNRRLYEEYNYKQRVMQLYDGFSRVVDEDGSEEQKEALIDVMIDAVKEKPSLMMSKYDRGGISLIDKLAGSTNHQDNSAKE
jgi:bifunctional ADP-heptose synthase (sugar kinase/adenylyltransferase)